MRQYNTQKHSWQNDLGRRLPQLISVFLIILPLFIYWQVQTFEFINMDDPLYVTDNPVVRNGLTKQGILWAFTFNNTSYWHPITWLSHMLDCEFYWLNPKGHHFTNVLFHISSALLLLLTLKTMTGALWRSAFVAALFALHPLNVESVAWVANRKNILSAFFWILAMWSYAHYARKPNYSRYFIVLFAMLLGLLAKPTVVTLPFVFLLLDFWPLGRFSSKGFSDEHPDTPTSSYCLRRKPAVCLILEKVPLIALSAASVVVSFMSSRHMGIIIPPETLPLWVRIQNALASYFVYIRKMFLPLDLAVFYPFPDSMPLWKTVTYCLVLLTLTVLALRFAKKRPYFIVGLLWYLGTLVPVIGLVQQGFWPATADRFAYIPLIGLFIMTVWGFSDLVDKGRIYRTLGLAAGSLAILGMGIGTWVQTGYWKNSINLFERAVSVTKDNYLAHYNLGVALYNSGRFDEGLFHCNEALRLNPDDEITHLNLGYALIHLGRWEDALSHFREALRINPASTAAREHIEMIRKRLQKDL